MKYLRLLGVALGLLMLVAAMRPGRLSGMGVALAAPVELVLPTPCYWPFDGNVAQVLAWLRGGGAFSQAPPGLLPPAALAQAPREGAE